MWHLASSTHEGVSAVAKLVREHTVRARQGCVSTGVDTKQTLRGGSALEVGDLRLLEDGGERSDALFSDAVASETASEG